MLQLEQDCDVDRAFRRLFAPGGVIQRDFGPQASRLDTSQFKEHATRYLQIFQPESGLSILPDKRYAGDRVDGRLVGGKIVVTKPFAKDSQISSLQGCIAEITLEEEPVMLRPVSLSLSLSRFRLHFDENNGGGDCGGGRICLLNPNTQCLLEDWVRSFVLC